MRSSSFAFSLLAACALVACAGAGDSSAPPPPDATPASAVAASSPNVSGVAGQPLGAPIVVRVTNKTGIPVAGATVAFEVSNGGGSVSPATTFTDPQGLATATWTLGPAIGGQTAVAAVSGMTVSFAANAVAGEVATFAKTTGDNQTAAVGTRVGVAPAIKVADANGNAVPGIAVTFSVASGDGTVSGASVTTGLDGTAQIGAWTLGTKPGVNTVRAAAGSAPPVVFSATAIPGTPQTVTLTAASTSTLRIDDQVALSAKAFDSYGNQNTTAAIAFSVSPAGAATVDNGGTLTVRTAGTFTVTATSGVGSATYTASAIGHPVGASVASSFDSHADPRNITVTDAAIWTMDTRIGRMLTRRAYDGSALAPAIEIQTVSTEFMILAPMTSGNTAVVVSAGGVSSSYWFVDIASNRVTDSITTQRYVQAAAISSDGSTAYMLLDAGELAVLDVPHHAFLPSISLGGGVQSFRLMPGDSIGYAYTAIGTMMEVDVRHGRVKRQFSMPRYDAFDISSDGSMFYVLDFGGLTMRVLRASDLSVIAYTITDGNMISLPPDGRAVFLGYRVAYNMFTPYVIVLNGDPVAGFKRGVSYPTSGNVDRIVFSSNGAAAFVINQNGWVDVIR